MCFENMQQIYRRTYLHNSCFDEYLWENVSGKFYSTYLPHFSIQICVLFSIFLTAFRITPRFCIRFSNSTRIRFCGSWIFLFEKLGYRNLESSPEKVFSNIFTNILSSEPSNYDLWNLLHFYKFPKYLINKTIINN